MPTNETLQLLIQAGVGTLALVVMFVMGLVLFVFVRWLSTDGKSRREQDKRQRDFDDRLLNETSRAYDRFAELYERGQAIQVEHIQAIKGLVNQVSKSALIGTDAIEQFQGSLSKAGDKTDQALREHFQALDALRSDINAIPGEIRKDFTAILQHFDIVYSGLDRIYHDLSALIKPTVDGQKAGQEPYHD